MPPAPPVHTVVLKNGTEDPELKQESLLEFQVWDAEQDLILYVQQLVVSNVSIEGCITNSYVYVLFDGKVEGFSTYNREVIHPALKTCDGGMVINGVRALGCSLHFP